MADAGSVTTGASTLAFAAGTVAGTLVVVVVVVVDDGDGDGTEAAAAAAGVVVGRCCC